MFWEINVLGAQRIGRSTYGEIKTLEIHVLVDWCALRSMFSEIIAKEDTFLLLKRMRHTLFKVCCSTHQCISNAVSDQKLSGLSVQYRQEFLPYCGLLSQPNYGKPWSGWRCLASVYHPSIRPFQNQSLGLHFHMNVVHTIRISSTR